jgi:hypothetical protein
MSQNVPIDLSGAIFKGLREKGASPPDHLVRDSIQSPTSTEKIEEDPDPINATLLRTKISGCDVIVLTIFKTTKVHEVWISLIVPAYLQRPTPLETLEFFAMRFGILFAISENVFKFARNIRIPVSADNSTSLITPLEDGASSFILFSPIASSATEVIIPIAFGIDLDNYARWRMTALPEALEGTFIRIHPSHSGRFQTSHLLDARAVFVLDKRVESEQGLPDEEFFTIECPGFHLSAGILNNKVFLNRNSNLATSDLPSHKKNDTVRMMWAWLPKSIQVAATSRLTQEEVTHNQCSTTPIFPPKRILAWARQKRMTLEFLYETPEHVARTVMELLEGVQDKILFSSMQSAFWNKSDNGTLTPKRETDVHKIVEALLFDGCVAKNLQCFAEPRIDGGNIDFLITGTLSNGEHHKICIEFKNAHAGDLNHGIETQLPAYMDQVASDFGFYCVLYYRCDDFSRPSQDPDDLRNELNRRIGGTGRKVVALIWDLGFQTS